MKSRTAHAAWIVAVLLFCGSAVQAEKEGRLSLDWAFSDEGKNVAALPAHAWLESGAALLYDRRLPKDERTIESFNPKTGKRKALFQADKIKTPLLLTHGDSDTNVPPGESDQLFIALRLLGAPVEYLSVEGQNHAIMEHDKRVRWSNSIVAWFDRWLKDRPEWWNAMYPPEAKAAP